MFTTDGGRKAPGRLRQAPSILAARSSAVGGVGAHWEGRVPEEDVAVVVEAVVGAEPEVRVLPLGGGVHPAALIAVERPFLVVVAHDVLAQLWAERFQQVAQVADDREVAQDRVALLHDVVGGGDDEQGTYRGQRPQPPTHAATLARGHLVAGGRCRRGSSWVAVVWGCGRVGSLSSWVAVVWGCGRRGSSWVAVVWGRCRLGLRSCGVAVVVAVARWLAGQWSVQWLSDWSGPG